MSSAPSSESAGGGLAVGAHHLFVAVQDLAELHVVLLAHPLEPVEPVRAVRCDGCEARDRLQPVVEERSAREHVRAATGDPPGREGIEAECVGNRGDVGHAVRDAAALRARRAAVAGTVVPDQSNALFPRQGRVQLVRETGGRCAVVEDDREACGIARLVHLERALVPHLDGVRHGAQLTGPRRLQRRQKRRESAPVSVAL